LTRFRASRATSENGSSDPDPDSVWIRGEGEVGARRLEKRQMRRKRPRTLILTNVPRFISYGYCRIRTDLDWDIPIYRDSTNSFPQLI
jgi:hypothetical protein